MGQLRRQKSQGDERPELTVFEAEARLQKITLEMTEGWVAKEWGDRSADNFAKFCRWLERELEELQKKIQAA